MNNSNKMAAILSNVSSSKNLKPLTDVRPIATLPFDCKYRLIDFPLSSLSNAHVDNIFMTFNEGETQSVFDHLGSGGEWGLDGFNSPVPRRARGPAGCAGKRAGGAGGPV